jgi:phytoene dehydrogenase-like protein
MTPLLEALATEPFPPQHEPPPRMRASDADREAVVQTLLDAIARGLLTLQEGDERVAAAYAARFLDELPGLTADLPPAPADAPAAPGWRALAVLAWLQLRTAVADLRRSTFIAVRFRPRLAIAVVALLALLSLVAATTGGGVGSHDHGHGAYGGDGWHDHDHDWDDDDD